MASTDKSERADLIRETVVFQLKLMADGLRDLVLVPVSLIASVIGLLRGGDDPGREFRQVIEVGRESEKWINLFGNHEVDGGASPAVSIDGLLVKVEEKLKQHYKTAGTSESAQAEIDDALHAVQSETKEKQ